MGKNKRKAQDQKASQKADRVVKVLFVSLVLIGILMLIGFSFMK